MAEQDAKSEIDKDVLALPAEVREDLVATAVKFLQNEKVRTSPLSQKKAFLQRKGLTNEEVELAVGRAGVTQDTTPVTEPVTEPVTNGSNQSSDSLVPAPGTSPPAVPVRELEMTRWMKAKEIVAVVAMVTGITYGAHRFYKEILRPWLFGVQTDSKRLEILEQIIAESSNKLATIEDSLTKQQEKLQMISHDVNSKMGGDGISTSQSVSGISDIKTELSSIKGLLLSRRNFPPLPTSTPALPAWQLASNSGDASKSTDADANSNEKGTSESSESTPTITFSSSPAPASPFKLDIEASETGDSSVVTINSDGESDSVAKNSKNESVTENEADMIAKNSNSELEGEKAELDKTDDEVNATGDAKSSDLKVSEEDEESDQSLD